MNASPLTHLAAALAALAAIAALAVPTALADPPNHQRYLPQAQTGLTHVPEIVGGVVASPEGRPVPRPEIIGGLASPGGGTVLASPPATRVTPAGFNWTDAGIGAGVALAAAAFVSASTLALRRRISLAH